MLPGTVRQFWHGLKGPPRLEASAVIVRSGSSGEGARFDRHEHVQFVQEHDPRLAAVSVDGGDVLEAVLEGGAAQPTGCLVQRDASGAKHRAFGDDTRAAHARVVFISNQVEEAGSHDHHCSP
jgi:hypothetical protein